MEERKIAERDFHDMLRESAGDVHVMDTRWSPEMEETISNNPLWTNMKYYAIERKSRQMVLSWFSANTPGKVVLDYCCGNGEDGVLIARGGAKKVYGIDISDVSIKNSQMHAKNANVEVDHRQGDAEATGFSDDMFDVVTEYGALHHLDLEKAFMEISRILKPNGKAICQEALAHNILIHLYRKLTPKMRTEWEVEHILRKPAFDVARKYFGKVEIRFFHLFSLFSVPFRNTFLFNPLLTALEWLDDVVLKIPGVKWQAWQAVIVLSEPKKSPNG